MARLVEPTESGQPEWGQPESGQPLGLSYRTALVLGSAIWTNPLWLTMIRQQPLTRPPFLVFDRTDALPDHLVTRRWNRPGNRRWSR